LPRPIVKEIRDRLEFLNNVGLDYLTLSRSAGSLSGGEAQRIRLATQIGSRLMGVLYVLDEPSIGLHQRDNARLIQTLKGCATWVTQCWWWNTTKKRSVPPIGCWIWDRVPASMVVEWSPRDRRQKSPPTRIR
jgi:ABC-type iron transport system FetAB ATPase subunit